MEKLLVVPTILVSKTINDLTKAGSCNVYFVWHFVNIFLLEIVHIAYLINKQPDIVEFATIEETITVLVEVST